MRSHDGERLLLRLFRKRKIAELKDMLEVLKVRSSRTVFRRLSAIGYVVSCSHAGRFYTLKTIPEYDQVGLWRYTGVLFSRHGTLKETVRRLVEESDAGQFHRELETCLQLRVHNTLSDLVDCRLLQRKQFAGDYLYLSANDDRAKRQVNQRSRTIADAVESKEYPAVLVIEVLLEIIHSAKFHADADAVAKRLHARGVIVAAGDVETILKQHGIVKKKARSRSTR